MPDNDISKPGMCQYHADLAQGVNDANTTLGLMKPDVRELKDDFKEVKKFILGDMENDKPGAAQRLRTIESFIDITKKAGIFLIGCIGSFAIYLIIEQEHVAKIIKKYLSL